ncbi:albumin-like [Anomaloglossus baeobatrachus]|uniref:albumin-like n=1 Tax=Anomaloglossus baeobatrachus TaxID=238106 RepID=UPI003F507306
MKWFALMCVLLCTIVTDSRHLQKRDADHHHTRQIGGILVSLGRENFRHILLAMIAQNFQKCTLEAHMKAVDELTTFAEHCVDHEDAADCKKPMNTIFYDKACKDPNLETTYLWSAECCAKTEPEREKCFHDHRDNDMGEFKRPDANTACTQHTEHPHEAFHYYIDTTGKRNPTLYPPTVLVLAKQYGNIMTECCAEEEREKCFEPKFMEVQKKTQYILANQRQSCHILSKFPERVYQAKKLTKLSQKFPAITFDVALKLSHESVHLSKDCCKDDVVECMIEKLEYTQHICDNQEHISHNLKACCDMPMLERTPCMHALPKDEAPADLSKEMKEFIEDEHVCQHFTDEKDVFLAKFLHGFSIRHGKLPFLSAMRVGKGYGALCTKCCASEDPVNCMKVAPQLFETRIKESLALAKQNCEAYKENGPHLYQTVLLGRYVVKMPTVTDETLLGITDKMTIFAGKCCALPEDQVMACAEEKLDLLLGEMCERESHTFINEQVHRCCVDSYSERRPCFISLDVDPTYKVPEFDASSFKVGAEICEGSEKEQKTKRFLLLIQVMKAKPNMSPENQKKTVGEFITVREKCCAADDRQACFDAERPAFLLRLKDLFEH